MDKVTHVYFPKWVSIFYATLAVLLVPWMIALARNLPAHHVVHYWDIMWVGFDFIILASLAITVWLAVKKSLWAILSATALATLFIVDAWFDIISARPGNEQHIAVICGVLEVALAIITYRVVFVVMSHLTDKKRFKLTSKTHHANKETT